MIIILAASLTECVKIQKLLLNSDHGPKLPHVKSRFSIDKKKFACSIEWEDYYII